MVNITRRDFVRQVLGLLALPITYRASRGIISKPSPIWLCLERFHIAGFRYYDGLALLARLRPGDRLRLWAEPDNLYDPWAVEVFWGENKLGYVPRRQNATIYRLLVQGAAVEGRICAVESAAAPWEMVEAEALLIAWQ